MRTGAGQSGERGRGRSRGSEQRAESTDVLAGHDSRSLSLSFIHDLLSAWALDPMAESRLAGPEFTNGCPNPSAPSGLASLVSPSPGQDPQLVARFPLQPMGPPSPRPCSLQMNGFPPSTRTRRWRRSSRDITKDLGGSGIRPPPPPDEGAVPSQCLWGRPSGGALVRGACCGRLVALGPTGARGRLPSPQPPHSTRIPRQHAVINRAALSRICYRRGTIERFCCRARAP